MHHQKEYTNFIAWYSIKFPLEPSTEEVTDPLKMPKLKLPIIEETKGKPSKYEDIELRDALGTNPSQHSESV